MKKIWVIGDPHGCYCEVMLLYKKLLDAGAKPEVDVFVFLGDYIDRGYETKQLIRQLMKWQKLYPHWAFLFGNHEDLMLDALVYGGRQYHSYDLWWMQGGKETAYSYIPKNRTAYEKSITQVKEMIPYSHLKWLTERPYYYETEDYFFVHGAAIPEMSLEDLKTKLDSPLPNEEKQAVLWGRETFIESGYNWGKKVIFGHTADYDGRYNPPTFEPFEPIIMENKIGIDTAVCPPSSRKLTALELPEERLYYQNSLP